MDILEKLRIKRCVVSDDFKTMKTDITKIDQEREEAAHEIERLRKQVEAMQWRPISEAPKEELVDLVMFNGTDVKAGQYWEGYWVDSFSDYIDPQPTHWMPLPPAPEE